MLDDVADKVNDGKAVTLTATVPAEVQPDVLPVTVYVVLVVGVTAAVLVVTLPAFELHVYEEAPLPVNVVLCPLQILDAAVAKVKEGDAVTFTEIVLVELHPKLVPVTV